MITKLLATSVLSLLLLTAPAFALSFEQPSMDSSFDQIDPGLLGLCACNPANEPAACTDSKGCEGTKKCTAVPGCSGPTNACGDDKCHDDYSECVDDCDNDFSFCVSHIDDVGGWGQTLESCTAEQSTCVYQCGVVRDACSACTGQWGACTKSDKCCAVFCEAGKECQPSTGKCVCTGTKELCGAKGTGDGIDNDCDGQTDEGCAACSSGQAQACTTSGCAGTQTCTASGTWGTCVKSDKCCAVQCASNKVCNGATGSCDCKSVTEACGDSVDNDCDGQTDEGCAPAAGNVPAGGAAQANNTAEGVQAGGANASGGNASGGNATAGFQQPGSGQLGNFPSGGQNLVGPVPAGPVQGGQQGIDPNMIILLAIVAIVVVGLLIAVKMMVGKKPPVAQPQPPVEAKK